jgi:hypothetical protein
MPVKVVKKDSKFRVVEARTGKVAKNAAGSPADGGGHRSRAKAVAQVQAINLSERRRKGKKAPPAPRK